jgi:Zn-dependent protease with chaperone function
MESLAPSAFEPRVPSVAVERWPTEIPLRILVVIASAAVWALLMVSIVGIVYAALLALFFFFGHLAFITHIKGSAVKLGPSQFPDLYQRVVELARRAGMETEPAAYLLQAGGSLNALATKLFRGRMIVLFSDLLEACGDDLAARDMVIGHEIGHLRSGHLNWFTLLAPGRLLPFLGAAYSRACEYTCDRWGAALCADRAAAARGLVILAAGGRYAGRVNLRAFVEQQSDLDTGWLTLGRWLSGYPPLTARVAAIEPAVPAPERSSRGPLRAALILLAMVAVPGALASTFALWWGGFPFASWNRRLAEMNEFKLPAQSASPGQAGAVADAAAAAKKVDADFLAITEVLREHYRETGEEITNAERLGEVWTERRADVELPVDPFDDRSYGLMAFQPGSVQVLSAGRDRQSWTADDIEMEVRLSDSSAPRQGFRTVGRP